MRKTCYVGHRGWIALDIRNDFDWAEIGAHLLASYKHFALQRMLLTLANGQS